MSTTRKIRVECNWCFWNGTRLKNRLSGRCLKYRKRGTVEAIDDNKKYTDEEFVRYRKIKMVDAGAIEIRHGIWVCAKPRVCSDKAMKVLYEFDDYYHLYMILFKDCVSMMIAMTRKRGRKVFKFGKAHVEILGRSHKRSQSNE